MKKTAFEKQVKRRITAREHEFFAVCPPGLVRVCTDELRRLGVPEKNITPAGGGVSFSCKPDLCMEVHLKAGSISRILMRIAQFRADSFHKFESAMDRIEWPLFLAQGSVPDFKVSTRKSALYHSDALAQRGERIIAGHIGTGPHGAPDNPVSQSVYIRAVHDTFTISLDCSGAPLYKRGIKKQVTPAPLRETLAATMLYWAGLQEEDLLIDPMCGSGTFSLEGALIKKNIAPGLFRTYAFETWPGFSSQTFAWLKKKALENIRPAPVPAIYAFDVDPLAVAALRENSRHPLLQGTIDTRVSDFFTLDGNAFTSCKKGVVMLNPPYGKRLDAFQDTSAFYHEIGRKLKSSFRGWRLGIIIPDQKVYTALGIKLRLSPIFHGGLDLFAGIGEI